MSLISRGAQLAAFMSLVALPAVAGAQSTTPVTQPDTIWACYVPTSGTMYRIKVADTKDDCVGNAVRFLWNVKGPKGDTGEKGEKGDKGDTGPQGPAGTGGGSFALPYVASQAESGTLFSLTNTGTGGAGLFASSSAGPSLVAFNTTAGMAFRAISNGGTTANITNSGNGFGVNVFSNGSGINVTSNTGNALNVNALTNAPTGIFATLNNTNGNNAIAARSNGRYATIDTRHSGAGAAIYGKNEGTGNAAGFANSSEAATVNMDNAGNGGAVAAQSAGQNSTIWAKNNGAGSALYAESNGPNTAMFVNNAHGDNFAVLGIGHGTYPAAQFENRETNGVALRTFGKLDVIGDLQVSQGTTTINGNFQVWGTKNAIVPTHTGMTKVYSEESTELWFTDYGEAQLVNGVAAIALDGHFSETVDLGAKYHVFVQANDDATLYVAKRTPTGFEVRVRDGEPNASFSYRIVAKRKGYAGERLAPADR